MLTSSSFLHTDHIRFDERPKPYTRSKSSPNILAPQPLTLEQERAQKNGALWECVKITPTAENANILTFRLKHLFNPYKNKDSYEKNTSAKLKEIYPAVEGEYPNLKDIFLILEIFGYEAYFSNEDLYIEMPDRQALIQTFESIKHEFPDREVLLDVIDHLKKITSVKAVKKLISELSGIEHLKQAYSKIEKKSSDVNVLFDSLKTLILESPEKEAILKEYDKLRIKTFDKKNLYRSYKKASQAVLFNDLKSIIDKSPDREALNKQLSDLKSQSSDRNTTLQAFEQLISDSSDKTALLKAFKQLKNDFIKRGWPSNLNIADSKGIAGDLQYSLAHILHGLISIEQEFCHDQQAHIIFRLFRLLEGKQFYDKSELKLTSKIHSLNRMVYLAQEQNPKLKQHQKTLEFILGMITDVLYNLNLTKEFKIDKAVKSILDNNFESEKWEGYMNERFSQKKPTGEEVKKLWQEVKESAYEFLAEKYQNEYQFKFDHLESDKQEVIKDNLLLFIRLSKRGLIIEDLSKVDFKFVKWLSKHHDRFLWLLDNGLAAEQILNFNADQKEHIFAKFSSITRFAKRISLPKLFDLEECLPNETRVIKLFKFSISKN